ncbi:MAG: cupin domain-containing protein [Alphaproteobacteria bacterium]|nr:cupin domain-containing protein [Alphaproteobacteria bacterium]
MSNRIRSFQDLIAPMSEDEFIATYHNKRFLHVRATVADKFADVMSWEILTSMLNMTSIWSPTSLGVFLDTQPIPAEQYCRPAVDRNNQQSFQPDAEKVKSWLRRGASLVANDVDTLWPGTAAAADALEQRFGGRAQSNLYCSWNQHQAFDTHFDTHDVFALHVAGEKVWRIFEGRLDNPIASEDFKSLGAEYHDAHRGTVAAEITLRPGDLLYIPRGQYHDALASSDGAIHLSFGLTHIIGIDVMTMLFEHVMSDPLFRTNMPLPEAGPQGRRDWLNGLAGRLNEIAKSDTLANALETFRQEFRYYRGGFDLPADALDQSSDDRFGVIVTSLEIVKTQGKHILRSDKGAVEVPDEFAGPISWIIAQGNFSVAELAAEYPQLGDEPREKLVSSLAAMKTIAPA